MIKKLITFAGILLALSCSTQKLSYKVTKSDFPDRSIIKFQDSEVEVDNILLEYTIEFMKEAHYYEIDVNTISKSFFGIFVDPIDGRRAGVTLINSRYGLDFSVIDPSILYNPAYTRVVVFHELYHKYGSPNHCHRLCGQIMSATSSPLVYYTDWERQKIVMFTNSLHFGVN